MDAKCRVCHRPSVDDLAGIPVCGRHRTFLLEEITEARGRERHQRLLGFGVPLHNVDDLSSETLLVCDHSTIPSEAHSWAGIPGDACYWCLSSYVEVYADKRAKLLGPINLDPEDARYTDEVLRRGREVAAAVGVGLITTDEARSVFERWSAHV